MKKSKRLMPERILCYIDYTKHSYELLDYANKIAELVNAKLYVLHTVTDIKTAAGFYVPHINTDKLEEEVIQAAKDKMYAMCMESVGELDPLYRMVRRGNPLKVISEVIDEQDIGLLVLSQDVSKGALAAFKTDYSDKYLKNPKCPVLVVPFISE